MPPVGIKNKNYLNVENEADPWMDAGEKRSRTDPQGPGCGRRHRRRAVV